MMSEVKAWTILIGLGFLGLFGLSAIFGSFYTVSEGEVGVVSTFGEYDNEEKTAGLHWKFPFIQDVDYMDVKMQTVNYKYNQDGYGKLEEGVFIQPRISILDAKNLPIGIDVSVQFTPHADSMSDILRTYGDNYLERKLNPIVRDVVRDVASGYDAENIAKERGVIGEGMKAKLAEAFKDLPFALNEVALRGIDLPETVARKIKEVQEAKQEEQRLEMEEKQAEVNKRIAIIAAEKVAAEKVIQAEGEAKALLEVATAEAKAIKLKGQSLRANPEVIQLNAVQQWDGVLPRFTGNNAVPFINVDKLQQAR